MKKFSDFKINTPLQGLKGDKIRMDRVLNKEIVIEDFRIEPSQFTDKGNGKCLYLQIKLKSEHHVIFTGSVSLQAAIEQVPKNGFPFQTIIVKEEDGKYKFT